MEKAKYQALLRFFVATGVSLSLLCSLFVVVVSVAGLQQFLDSIFWFFAGSSAVFAFMTISLRFFIFKDELGSVQPSASRFLSISYFIVGLLGVTFIYGRLYFHSLPEGKRVHEKFKLNQTRVLKK